MHAVVHALHIDAENFVKIGFRSAFKVSYVRDSGVVYQDVDTSLLKYLVKSSLNAIVLGHVAAVSFRVAASGCNFACNRFGSVLVDVQHADAGSATGKPLSDCPANAARPAGNYGKFTVEPKRVRITFQKSLPRFDLRLNLLDLLLMCALKH